MATRMYEGKRKMMKQTKQITSVRRTGSLQIKRVTSPLLLGLAMPALLRIKSHTSKSVQRVAFVI